MTLAMVKVFPEPSRQVTSGAPGHLPAPLRDVDRLWLIARRFKSGIQFERFTMSRYLKELGGQVCNFTRRTYYANKLYWIKKQFLTIIFLLRVNSAVNHEQNLLCGEIKLRLTGLSPKQRLF